MSRPTIPSNPVATGHMLREMPISNFPGDFLDPFNRGHLADYFTKAGYVDIARMTDIFRMSKSHLSRSD